MEEPGFFDAWLGRVECFLEKLEGGFDDMGFPARIQHLGCNFFIYVGTREPMTEYRSFEKLNLALEGALFRNCIHKGLYFHTDFTISAQHGEKTLEMAHEKILEAAREVKLDA